MHQVLPDLLAGGLRAFDPEAVATAVQSHSACEHALTHRQMLRHRVTVAVATYLRCWAPPPHWEITGAEVPVPGGRLDMVWRTNDGNIYADEIKVTRHDHSHRTQIDALARGAAETYGAAFRGLRHLRLNAPQKSELVATDGARTPLVPAID